MRQSTVLSVSVIFVVLFFVVIPSGVVKCYRLADDQELERSRDSNDYYMSDSKKIQTALKIVKAYLEYQIDEIDAIISKEESQYDEDMMDKRQLKSQGILERLKNKMQHDLNKYGWD